MSTEILNNSILFSPLSVFKTDSSYPFGTGDETGPSSMAAMRDAFSRPFSVALPVSRQRPLVPDVLPLHHEDDVLADVRRMIGHPLEVPRHEDEVHGAGDGGGVRHHERQQFPEDLVFQMVDGVVPQDGPVGDFVVS